MYLLMYVISADEVGVYKPSPLVYDLVVLKTGLGVNSIGFVSSNSFDVNGAKSFGLWTCWVNRSKNIWDELDLLPDVTVESLTELADILPK